MTSSCERVFLYGKLRRFSNPGAVECLGEHSMNWSCEPTRGDNCSPKQAIVGKDQACASRTFHAPTGEVSQLPHQKLKLDCLCLWRGDGSPDSSCNLPLELGIGHLPFERHPALVRTPAQRPRRAHPPVVACLLREVRVHTIGLPRAYALVEPNDAEHTPFSAGPVWRSERSDLPDYRMLGMLQRALSTCFREEKPWGALHAQIGTLQGHQHLIVW